MLHLAQVQKNQSSDGIELQLLATQTAKNIWVVGNGKTVALTEQTLSEASVSSNNLLVLVDLDENHQILNLQNVTNWVLELVKTLSNPENASDFSLEEEEARIEQWRQELTSQSQDITRRNLEIETRREQMQELEASLQQEKEELERRWQELKVLEERHKGTSGLSESE
ncbi:hypothetical protein IQ249_10200 [Lusitaniella coriacea LEGE 07157]|uniref:Uncharacterized protein n=1 Tax=Lusitaniella coriacea LEGE 07157 TaxID=945747 RepID=A0A8J7ISM2_9CYAN|nr:hypothetical protein [Lusitaniella coriacea]MBE9116267.1 hypothetical protein [Lusitaniella coriacea LEGE 07157]